MNTKDLQKALDEKNIPAKVLHVKKTNYDDYEVIYTFDLSYEGRDYSNIESIIEPEDDELVENLEDAVFIIGFRYKDRNGLI